VLVFSLFQLTYSLVLCFSLYQAITYAYFVFPYDQLFLVFPWREVLSWKNQIYWSQFKSNR